MGMQAAHAEKPYDTTAAMHLSNAQRLLVRSLWAVIAIPTGVLFVLGLPYLYDAQLGEAAVYAESLAALNLSPTAFAAYTVVLDVVRSLIFISVALLLFIRKPDKLGVFVSLMLITFGVGLVSSTISSLRTADAPWNWIAAMLQGLGNAFLVIFLYVLPDGRFYPRWTRPAAVIWLLWSVIGALPGSPVDPSRLFGPVGGSLLPLFWYVTGIVAQTQRSNHLASQTHLQQVKWVTFGLGAGLLGFIGTMISAFLLPAEGLTPGGLLWLMLVRLLFLTIAQAAIPVMIAFSVFHYRLWEIDFLINRTLVYGILTLVLGSLFVGTLLVLQALLGAEQSPIILAGSALVIGTLFQPARRRLKRAVDHYYFRVPLDVSRLSGQPVITGRTGALTGTQIGPYQVLEALGRGGMAEVYRGYHAGLERTVAIKVLLDDTAQDDNVSRRFEREAQTIAALRHPNIVQVFDFGKHETMRYMVMEYVPGQDLTAYLREHGMLALEAAYPLLQGIAAALDYAHQNEVVHRDVKPSNVLLRPDPSGGFDAVLTDFGIAKIRSGGTGLTKTGIVGTLDYIAPEQILSSREVDYRADIYSLGILCYQMLTGELPFRGDNPGVIVLAHLQTPPPDPRRLAPSLPDRAARAVMMAMSKDPDDRYESAAAFLGQFRE